MLLYGIEKKLDSQRKIKRQGINLKGLEYRELLIEFLNLNSYRFSLLIFINFSN